MTRKVLLWLPFALGIGLFAAFWVGLRHPDDHVIASKVVDQPLPDFITGTAVPGQPASSAAAMRDGKPRLLNIFASWCVPCAAEAPVLMRLKAAGVEIDGVAVHDTAGDLAQFLGQNGNPYHALGLDIDGRAQMAFGSTGVPETFVVDAKGRIIHQHIGAVGDDDVPQLLSRLRGGK